MDLIKPCWKQQMCYIVSIWIRYTSKSELIRTAILHWLRWYQHIIPESTWLHELVIQGAPGLFDLLQVLLHDLDISEGTVALWEAGWAMAPAVIVAAEQLALWVARHIAEGCLYKTPTQEFWQDILQTWKKSIRFLHNYRPFEYE